MRNSILLFMIFISLSLFLLIYDRIISSIYLN
nr:MAG TPA: hypothetical protein [Caudoviricetes sp.]